MTAISTAIYLWKYNSRSQTPDSLWQVLDYYSFSQPQQKQALEQMLRRAGIIEPHETFMTIFPKRKDLSLLFHDMLRFVELTQQNFTKRSGTQERWEVEASDWMIKYRNENLADLGKLGIIDAVLPTISNPDLVAILGSTMGSMVGRIEYAENLSATKQLTINLLALIAGERKVTVGIDGNEQQLIAIAQKYYVNNFDFTQLTETDLIKEVFYNSPLSNQISKQDLIIIDTPRRDLPRPTTETTIQELCAWLKSHQEKDIKFITFVSNQPHVRYQQAVIQEVLQQQLLADIKFEVVGNKVRGDLNTAKIQDLIGALGAQIWAQTPAVIRAIAQQENSNVLANKELAAKILAIYKKQPLIYNNLINFYDKSDESNKSSNNPRPLFKP